MCRYIFSGNCLKKLYLRSNVCVGVCLYVSMCVAVCVYECECVVLFLHISVFVFVCLLAVVLEVKCSGPKTYPE